MSCEDIKSISYFPGDNEPFKVTIQNKDGSRVANIQTNTDDIIFQGIDGNGAVVIDLRRTTSKIVLSTEVDNAGKTIDVATISPSTTDTDITPGEYDAFLKLNMNTPTLKRHLVMIKDGSEVTKIVIKEGGIAV